MAAIRLVKIAKELNVGTSTIVDFLKGKGYEIENKPTSKISDEMHDELLVEFSDSMAAKEKADQMVIGSRYEKDEAPAPPVVKQEPKPEPVVEKAPEKAPEPTPEPVVEKAPEPTPAPPPVVKETPTPKPEPKPEPVAEKPAEPEVKKRAVPGIKVLGKIDLSTAGKAPKKEKPAKPEAKKVPEPAPTPEPVADKEAPVKSAAKEKFQLEVSKLLVEEEEKIERKAVEVNVMK